MRPTDRPPPDRGRARDQQPARPEDLIHKAVGTVLRSAGQEDRGALLTFLDEHASRMPRIMLTHAIEHLDAEQKADYRSR